MALQASECNEAETGVVRGLYVYRRVGQEVAAFECDVVV